jgi:hypothetical protein
MWTKSRTARHEGDRAHLLPEDPSKQDLLEDLATRPASVWLPRQHVQCWWKVLHTKDCVKDFHGRRYCALVDVSGPYSKHLNTSDHL